MMPCVIKALGYADGRPCWLAGTYLVSFDFEAAGGRGKGKWAQSKKIAHHFHDAGEAMEFWRTQSKTVPRRIDGEPNRPLTSLTIEIEPVEDTP
jgi:hypothetical protein